MSRFCSLDGLSPVAVFFKKIILQTYFLYIIKINSFRGDLSDVSAKTATLVVTTYLVLQGTRVNVRYSEIVCVRKRISCKILSSDQDIHLGGRKIICLEVAYVLNPVCLEFPVYGQRYLYNSSSASFLAEILVRSARKLCTFIT